MMIAGGSMALDTWPVEACSSLVIRGLLLWWLVLLSTESRLVTIWTGVRVGISLARLLAQPQTTHDST